MFYEPDRISDCHLEMGVSNGNNKSLGEKKRQLGPQFTNSLEIIWEFNHYE